MSVVCITFRCVYFLYVLLLILSICMYYICICLPKYAKTSVPT